MNALVLGPLLRRAGDGTATVWVETSRPGTVGVGGASAPTFTVHGHHYALVEVSGLAPGSETPYEVTLDGERVWPEPDSPFPPSVIRMPADGTRQRIAFGSCRQAPADETAYGPDTLAVLGRAIAGGAAGPDVLLLIGDQIYGDETGPDIRAFIEARRDAAEPPFHELADFEEYAEQYRLSWGTDPAVRWLLSTVPTLMIFDDHDIRDDWNTSAAWRADMAAHPWWRDRIVHGLGAYWVYQHLGNLAPAGRAADQLYTAVRAQPGDAGKLVEEYAERADREPVSARWSYGLDLGRTRILVVDSRCRRQLAEDRRGMLDDDELAWLDAGCAGGWDHLVIASSLPYLLAPSIHHLEGFDEALARGAWGARFARFGEKLRQAADLEHWAAFDRSFRAVAASVTSVLRGERGPAPATVLFLGGDVHYSYLARVRGLPVTQVVCSPLRNPLRGPFKWANVAAAWWITAPPARLLARLAGVRRPPLRWRISEGPWFANALATIEVDGRTAAVRWSTPSGPAELADLRSIVL